MFGCICQKDEKIRDYSENFFLNKKQFLQKNNGQKSTCHICGNKFNHKDRNYFKVRDLCHYTRKHQETTHSTYNLCYKGNSFIPVATHNATNFDNHLILLKILQLFEKERFLYVAENREKFIYFI